jgi:hypothetical protein
MKNIEHEAGIKANEPSSVASRAPICDRSLICSLSISHFLIGRASNSGERKKFSVRKIKLKVNFDPNAILSANDEVNTKGSSIVVPATTK